MKVEIGDSEDWNTIASKLPGNWRELAREHGILTDDVRRSSAESSGSGWKIRDVDALLRLILHYVTTTSSLRTTVALAAALGLADITAPALHKWLRKCGSWLAAMTSAMIAGPSTFSLEKWAGYVVIAVDATTAQMPGATTTTARVHYALRLFDLAAVAIEVTDHKIGETLRNFAMKAGELWVADRGYCNANGIAHAVTSKSDVLIRFAFGSLPLFDRAGADLDVRQLVRGIKGIGVAREWAAWVHPREGTPIRGRLVAVRLPEDKAEKARARLYREHKKSKVTPLMREFAGYVVLFTTVPSIRLSATSLVELYRARWLVELDFKRAKSIAGLGKLPSRLPETIHSWMCAKMLAIQIARRLAEPGEPFPPSIVGAYALRLRASHIRILAAKHRS